MRAVQCARRAARIAGKTAGICARASAFPDTPSALAESSSFSFVDAVPSRTSALADRDEKRPGTRVEVVRAVHDVRVADARPLCTGTTPVCASTTPSWMREEAIFVRARRVEPRDTPV